MDLVSRVTSVPFPLVHYLDTAIYESQTLALRDSYFPYLANIR